MIKKLLMKRLLLVLLLCAPCWSAQIIRYVDPDATGAENGRSWTDAYQTLKDWNTAEGTDLDAANNYMTVYCRSSGGTADTDLCNIGGWKTSATDYIEIIGTDFPSDGKYSTSAYRIEVTNANTGLITVSEDFVSISNIQFKVTCTGIAGGYGINVNGTGAGSELTVDSCIIQGVSSTSGVCYGVFINDFNMSCKISNCVIYGFVNGADAEHAGIRNWISITTNVYNCTIYGCYNGIYKFLGTVNATNCAVGNTSDDFRSLSSVTYCMSDDGDGTNSQDALSGDWDNEFVDANNGDFTLVVGGNAIDNGTDNPGSGLYLDDIIGTTRVSSWDIGAYEYAASDTGTVDWWWRRRHNN